MFRPFFKHKKTSINTLVKAKKYSLSNLRILLNKFIFKYKYFIILFVFGVFLLTLIFYSFTNNKSLNFKKNNFNSNYKYTAEINNNFKVSVGEKNNIASLLIGDSGKQIKFTPIDSNNKPIKADSEQVSNTTTIYKNIPGNLYTIKHTVNQSGVKEEIIINNKEDAKKLLGVPFKYQIDLKGLKIVENDRGEVFTQFKDLKTNEIYTIPEFFMFDSKGEESVDITVQLDLISENKYMLTVTPSEGWILDAEREFPIIIDPTIVKGVAPVAVWNFDNGYGTTTPDLSGNSNTGTITGATFKTSGCPSNRCLSFDGNNDYVSVADSASVDLNSNFTVSAFIKPVFNTYPDSVYGILDKGAYSLYIDPSTRKVDFRLGNSTTSWSGTKSRDGSQDTIRAFIEYNGFLYQAQGNDAGEGDIYVYNGSAWNLAYDGGASIEEFYSFAVYKGVLYTGAGLSNGDGDIYACTVSNTTTGALSCSISFDNGGATTYEAVNALIVFKDRLYAGMGLGSSDGDIFRYDGVSWSKVYDGSNNIYDFAVYKGNLYAAQGSTTAGSGLGDIYVSSTGDSGSWSQNYNGAQEAIAVLRVYGDHLYAGQGTGAGDGDVLRYDGSSWTTSYDPGAGYEYIASLGYYNGRLYAGGGLSAGDGDIFVFDGSSWSTSRSDASTFEYAYSFGSYGGQFFAGMGLSNNDGDTYVLPGGGEVSSTSTLESNKVYHVAVTKSGTTLSLYLNGMLQGTTTLGSSTVETNTMSLLIGKLYSGFGNGSSYADFKGLIDDVKIFNYTLNEGQVRALSVPSSGRNIGTASFASNINSATESNLIGWWRLNETSGNAADSSGNDLTLTDASSTTYEFGKFANAADLESSSTDYLYVADNTAMSITTDVTISAWIKPESNTVSTLYNIAGKWDGANESYLLSQYGDEIRMYIDSSSNYATTNAANLTTGNWYHVVGTYSASSRTVTIFVNGAIFASTVTGTIPASIGDDAGRFHIGAEDSTTAASNYYDGIVDDVRLYSKWMSKSDVQKLYSYAPSPYAYFDFNEKSGTTTVYDKSGNGITGTMNGSMTSSDWVQGKFGSALDFDGIDDEIDIGLIDFDTNRPFTISSWIYPTSFGENGTGNVLTEANGYLDFYISQSNNGLTLRAQDFSSASSNSDVIDLNNWQYITVTYNGSGNANFYVNGVNVTNDNTVNMTDNTGTFRISYNASSFEGKIDDYKIYNYARTPAQIIGDMNAGHPTPGSPIGSALAHYKFDEGVDNTCSGGINDVCNWGNGGSSLDGAITGATWTTLAKYGKALSYDSVDDRVIIKNSALIQGGSEGTICAWVYPNNTDSTEDYIYSEDITGGTYFHLRRNSSNQFSFGILDNSTWRWASAATSHSANQWYQVCGVFKQSTLEISLYVNGSLSAQNSSWNGTWNAGTITNVLIGDATNTGTYGWGGYIDEVKIYNLALTASQVAVEYNSGKASSMGALSTESDGVTPSNSANRQFCVPGDTSTCNPPVAWYKFDEGTGTSTVRDSSGNNLTGTMNGSMTASDWVPGKVGKALDFDGSDDTVSYTDGTSSPFDVTSAYTLSVWFYPRSLSFPFGWANIVTKGDNYPSDMYGIGISDTGLITFIYNRVSGGRGSADSATGLITAGKWYHAEAVYGGSYAYLYLDGNLVAQSTFSNTNNNVDNYPFMIGNRNTNGLFFNGMIDDVKLYNYARTPAQIAWDYNRGAPIAWYKFDECSGTTIKNWAKNSNGALLGSNGSLTIGGLGSVNSAGTCSTSGAWYNGANGNHNGSISLDGTDDYITVAHNSSQNIPGSFSISSWIYINNFPGNGYYDTVVTKDPAPGNEANYYLEINDTNDVNCGFYSGGSYRNHDATAASVGTGRWEHLTCVFNDESNLMKIFVNGGEVYSGNETNTPVTTSSDISIGRVASNMQYIDGRIDDLRIYNYALTAEQVKQVMNSGAAKFE